jgi:hypothetical protein
VLLLIVTHLLLCHAPFLILLLLLLLLWPPQGSMHDVSVLHTSLCEYKVARNEGLERLGAGLYKHMQSATDGEGGGVRAGVGAGRVWSVMG